MNYSSAEFYATAEMHLRVARRFMEKAAECIKSGDLTLDEMLADMRRMNAERALASQVKP